MLENFLFGFFRGVFVVSRRFLIKILLVFALFFYALTNETLKYRLVVPG